MQKFVIEGGVPLSGTMFPAGNKNGALPILASSILTEDEVVVRNVPRIRDVDAMLAILSAIGVSVDWRGPNEVSLCAACVHEGAGVQEVEIEPELAEQIRASFLLAGPLLARFGRAVMPPPGGDVIGRRRLDPHLDAFRAMGATADCARDIVLSAPRGLRATDVFMDEPSVMATENVADGRRAHAGNDRDRQCGVRAARAGPGADAREDGRRHPGDRLEPDDGQRRRDAARVRARQSRPTTSRSAASSRSPVSPAESCCIKDTVPRDLRMIRLVFERLGLRTELDGNDVLVPGGQKLIVQADVGEYKSKIQDGPWPAFPADLTSIAVALATQAEGSILVHEWMFENRLIFTDKLILMGADIVMCDPHRAIVTGPRRLRGERVESPDIRAGMAMLLAALCAEGRSEIGNIRQIDRGYERIDERLRELGARIERVATEPVHA